MKLPETLTIATTLKVYQSDADLETQDLQLLQKAREAANKAYAPYSNFYVGAALLLENGEIVTGNNQENAAYPSGLCAERTAVFYASSQHPHVKIRTIAVAYRSENTSYTDPISPCGACRQVLAEYEVRAQSPIRMIMASQTGKIYIAESIESLLPVMFNRQYLK